MARATAVPVSGSKLDNRRVLAALIDLLIVGAGYSLILAAAGKLGEPDAGGALTAVGIGWALYYYFACESGDGQTVGKHVMKIRVVRTDGAAAGLREIALRTILRVIDGLFLYLVGLIVMLATRERRGRLGDLVGGTMIVSVDKPAPVVDMSAPEAPAAVSRVPIAESGPAFEPTAEVEPAEEPDVASPSLKELASDVTAVTEDPEREVEEEEPVVEELPAAEAEPVAEAAEEPVAKVEEEPTVEVDEEPVAEVEEEPTVEVEEEPTVEVEEEPVAEDEPAAPDEPEGQEPADESEEEPVADAEEPESDEDVTVKSVETVSAIDLVMEGDDEEAVAGPQSKAKT